MYRALKKRLDYDYSIKTGNITVLRSTRSPGFGKDPRLYIHDLRDLLRAREDQRRGGSDRVYGCGG
jgi:hypothetical protein